MDVIEASYGDIPQLTHYIARFHQASPFAKLAFSPGRTGLSLQHMIESPTACIFMHEFGAIGGQLLPLPFGPGQLAQEIFWWAQRDGFSLLGAFENWAAEKQAALVCVSSLSDPRFEKIYGRRGYAPSEHFFVKTI